MRRVVRITRLARRARREFRRDCLTKSDRAGGPGECDARRIACGPMFSMDARAVGCGHIDSVDHILFSSSVKNFQINGLEVLHGRLGRARATPSSDLGWCLSMR